MVPPYFELFYLRITVTGAYQVLCNNRSVEYIVLGRHSRHMVVTGLCVCVLHGAQYVRSAHASGVMAEPDGMRAA